MIILSDSLAEKADEGCLKVANSLAKRLKKHCPDVQLLSYGERQCISDRHLRLNGLFLNKELFELLRKKREPLLYIPFASNTLASMIRLWVLRLFNRGNVRVIFALRHPMNALTRFLLKYSGAGVIALSASSYETYRGIVGDRVTYLKTGVDTKKFTPVDEETKLSLRKKYGIPEEKRVVLHVGHLNRGRNVGRLCELDGQKLGLLVLSSETKDKRDPQLQQELEQCPNVMLLDRYIADIQEIYQLADVYLFPVCAEGSCIDLPLSALEAAACGIPLVTTAYGELKEFRGKSGFLFPENLDRATLNEAVETAASWKHQDSRMAVLEYDWNLAIRKLMDKG